MTENTGERLQKYIAKCGAASRRAAEELIRTGRVSVNSIQITEMGTRVYDGDIVLLDGKPLSPETSLRYIMLNKPLNVVTTANDPQGRRTVIDLLDDVDERVVPVGRLDFNTEGLLLLSNDGELVYRLTHPKYEVEKVYIVGVRGEFTQRHSEALKAGVMLDDGMTAPARVLSARERGRLTFVTLAIHEGKNHIVRRMMGALGFNVDSLTREAIGPLSLGKLKCGEYRDLTDLEVRSLKRMCGLLK